MLSRAVNEDAEASISSQICPSYRAQKEHGAESKSVSSVILVTAPSDGHAASESHKQGAFLFLAQERKAIKRVMLKGLWQPTHLNACKPGGMVQPESHVTCINLHS